MKSPRRTAPAPARATPPSPGQRLLRNLHLLRALVAATLEEGGLPPEHGISVVQMSVLRLVAARHGTPTALGEIARRLEVSVPAASKAIARLVASGHLRSRADRADARRLRVDVTDAGENAIRRFEAARERRADAVVARAGAATAERWIETTDELVRALLDAGRRDALPCLQCGLLSPSTCAAEQYGAGCPVRALEERAARGRIRADN
jgi:DNA-binding MarR family transcriptional regulator